MANTITKVIDTGRKVVYLFTGSGAEGRTLKLDAGKLYGALNANGQFSVTAGTDRKSKYRLTLKSINYDICGNNSNGYVEISTDGDAANTILFLSGQNNMVFAEAGEPFTLDCAGTPNTTGNIYLTGTGTTSYTVIMDFRKNGMDYSQGQIEDPMAFNNSPRGVGG